MTDEMARHELTLVADASQRRAQKDGPATSAGASRSPG